MTAPTKKMTNSLSGQPGQSLAPAPGSASAQLEWLWANCNIVYWPEDGSYPIEHNPHTSKYMRDIIEIHMPNK